MNDTRSLAGTTIAILATHGFEQSELTVPQRELGEAGAEVHVLSLEKGSIRAWSDGDWSDEVDVDFTLDDVEPNAYDALVLPGGVWNPDQLRVDAKAIDFVQSMIADAKPVAAICHGPWTLIDAGGVEGREVTSWPSLRRDLENAGARWIDEAVVHDGPLITSRNPDDLPRFCDALIEAVFAASSARVG